MDVYEFMHESLRYPRRLFYNTDHIDAVDDMPAAWHVRHALMDLPEGVDTIFTVYDEED